jgi:hypothetical protein
MELVVKHNFSLLKQSSILAGDRRLKLMPNGVGFFCFNLPVKLLNVLKDTKNAMPKMPI